jgi:DNA gyrase/topoisomerase IV subunit A
MRTLSIEQLINTQYKKYSLYTVESRAIPYITDGLKPVMRRSLWIGTKLAKDWVKVTKLAGATLSLHPHGSTSVEDAISSNAQRFSGANNVCWFNGKGAFGSKIVGPGNGIGAARYVSVKLSDHFYKIMDVDHDLIELQANYDDTEQEPKSFLPLVPTVLLNPVQGIAVGFACNILPRKLEDIIHCQIQHIQGKDFREPKVFFDGFKGKVEKLEHNTWKVTGVFEKKGNQLHITELPIGTSREQFIKILDNLEDKEIVSSFIDGCTDEFDFIVNLKVDLTDDEIYEKFKLYNTINENINVIDISGKIRNMTVSEIIKEFTDYRFKFYLARFKKQFHALRAEFEFEKDLLRVIQKGLFKKFPNLKKAEIHQLLLENEIKEENIPKIIQTPIYKFGKDEIEKIINTLKELKIKLENLIKLCKNEDLRKDEYIKELKGI